MKMFEVGGCVRDELLGIQSKDIDFAVEASSFDAMVEELAVMGFTIFLRSPEFFTVRARFPRDWKDDHGGKTADFVLCRREGPYSDGRRPDFVEMGTLMDDLARRDFTVNAMARGLDGELIDPFGGAEDLKNRVLRCVGVAEDRISEDPLRALRAVRFIVTKNLVWDKELVAVLCARWLPEALASVSVERRREEMAKAMHTDTMRTLALLFSLPIGFREAVFADGMWLKPTMEK